METPDLVNDLNALLQKKRASEDGPSAKNSLEEQIAAARTQAAQPTEPSAEPPADKPAANTPAVRKPAPAADAPSSGNDNLLDRLTGSEFTGDVMKKILLDFYGPNEKTEDDSDNPKRELYERAIRNDGSNLAPAAYAILTAEISMNSSSEKKDRDPHSFLLNSHPQGKALSAAAYQLEKVERLFSNEQNEEGFLEAEETLLSTDIKLYLYRLINLMGTLHSRFEKNVRKGIPGKLGEDVRRCTNLPYASAREYRSGVFCSLLFTAALLFFLWSPPLREFFVTTIQPDHFLHVCVVIIVIMFFVASWAGAIISLIILGLIGAGIEKLFGEAALATTLIVLIYLVGGLILFLLARHTGYSKVKKNKNHKKLKRQRAEMRRALEPQLRRRLAKLDEIQAATKLDSDGTPEVLYWTAMTKVADTETFRRNFRNNLSTLRSLYQDALNSL